MLLHRVLIDEKMDFGVDSITKLRTSCLTEFDAHWNCLENNNQVRPSPPSRRLHPYTERSLRMFQEFFLCRKPEKTLNDCVFKEFVAFSPVLSFVAYT